MEPAACGLPFECAVPAAGADVVPMLLRVTICVLPSHKQRPNTPASTSAAAASDHLGKARSHGARGSPRAQG